MDNPVVFVRSINLRSALRATSFSGRNSEPTRIRIGSGKMTYKTSVSFRGRELETKISLKSPTKDKESKIHVKSVSFKDEKSGNQSPTSPRNLLTPLSDPVRIAPSPLSEPEIQRIEAAIWLQKVYKSFRTRRRLADCAVLAEQRWWKVLDFAELKQSSVSFFEIKKPQTATTRWTRATTKAAKVGKGLSKAEKARKLALQHWLEAIDPRHRYGHNLQYYYVSWLHCNSRQPFFFWLDIGDGREVNLERCPRSKLHQQCIKYLDPIERSAYEVVVSNGKLVYKMSRQVVDTTGGPKDVKWIFVLSTSKNLYVGQKSKGKFQHSSFLAGGATLSAGRLEAENGILKAIWPHSGHYLPTEENFQELMAFLLENNVDLTNVKRSSSDESEFTSVVPPKNNDLDEGMHSKLAKLEIPKRGDAVDVIEKEGLPQTPKCSTKPRDLFSQYYYQSDDDSSSSSDEDDDGTAEDSPFLTLQKLNLFDEDQEDEKPIPKEQILQRIDSHNGRNSYQLAHQLTCKWSTGAGPRISCIKDYPSELRMRILEQACLYPRLKVVSRSPSVGAFRPPKHPQHRRVTTMI